MARAEELGFAAAGIALAGATTTFPLYQQWLADGQADGMSYLARHAELRRHPADVAPGTRSIIGVAARYPTNPLPGAGFSTYARGQDYHTVIRRKLKELAAFIGDRNPLTVARVCVDSAPLLEREWAVRAGLGWRGKQGQIVHPRLGCCLLLGFLLVDIELEPSPPRPNQCGTCRLCIEACPNGALSDEGTLTTRRCIAYLTIERAGDLRPEDARAMGDSLFGCDCCTAVCPWNRYGADRIMPELTELPCPTPRELAAMDEAAFGMRFKDTVVWRTGLQRLKRNAAAVCENASEGSVHHRDREARRNSP